MNNKIKSIAPSGAAADIHAPLSDWALMNVALTSRFILAADGRMESENYPDLSDAPLMFMAGCATGNLLRLGPEVDAATASEIEALAASEPPLQGRDSTPVHLARYLGLLSRIGAVEPGAGLTFHLPHGVPVERDVRLVFSSTREASRLCDELVRDGMPSALIEMGFRSVEDLWEPWCLALDDREIASLAFAARLGPLGAELGLATSPPFRGRGLAALTTAGWSSHPALADRRLFYSTARANLASQRVVAKLGLRLIGATMDISRQG